MLSLPNVDVIIFSADFICFVTAPRTYYYTGAFISDGSRHPADGDYLELVRASGIPSSVNPVAADISQYRGNTSVYIGFLYVGTNSHRMYVDNVKIVANFTGIDNAQIAGPAALSLTSYDTTPVLTGYLYRAGETGGVVPAPGYEAQIGYGPRGTLPGAGWVWFDAPYSAPPTATMSLPVPFLSPWRGRSTLPCVSAKWAGRGWPAIWTAAAMATAAPQPSQWMPPCPRRSAM